MSELKEFFKGKDIIVTGGIGSIGSEVVVQLLKYEPRQVRIFDNRETEIFHMQHLLKNHKNVRYLVGDVREKDRLRKAFAGCDIVFHAAALKHVPSCEYNPFEAVKTNILGTQNVIEAAIEEGVRKVIFISTDKAVNPINTMGASKLLAEKLMLNANISGNKDTIFSCVRFGNVLNSNGSVIPLFKNQIENGGPVTLTHGDMRRFFISIPQAIDLVLRAAHKAKGREIFVLKMQGCKVKDLAEVIINEYAPTIGKKPEDIKIETVGLRAGEKIDELLISEEELEITSEDEDLFVI
ncbi:MAG: polysaccharide biosynthesis protein, partial [Nanoarchaeota archaeon]|nr:polysaccharide biosynthesis protein [Nanoarchaeota archaeon]